MKAALWVVFTFLAGLWTALVAASVELIAWAVGAMGSGRVGELASGAADWPVPAWLGLWIDPAWLLALQAGGLGLVQWVAQGSTNLSGVMDWLTPLIWVAWGIVFVVMLLAAMALHWLVGRLNGPTPPQGVHA